MIYTWEIDDLFKKPSVDGLTDVVTSVMYACRAKDETTGNEYTYHHVVQLPPPNSANFKDFSLLTEAEVLAWVEANVDKPFIYSVIEDRMNMTPGDGLTVPWGSQSHNDGGN